MPVVKFDKGYLNKLIRFKLDDRKLQDQLSKLGLEVEEMTRDELSIELSPSRPDLLDPVGLARALRNFMHKSSRFHYSVHGKQEMSISVSRDVKSIRPFIAGAVAKVVKLDEVSLTHLMSFTDKFCDTFGRKRRRIAIGMHNLAAIESKELSYSLSPDDKFVPLNSSRKESYSSILKSNKKGIEYAGAIDDGNEGYPVLRDSKGTLALIPIINSERTKVTKSTTDLLIDVTGTSEYAVEKSMDLLAAMLSDMGAEVSQVSTLYGKQRKNYPVMQPRTISIELEEICRELGVSFDYEAAISLANKMGYEAALLGKRIRFSVPEYRLDVINGQDIVEDMAIAYGYDYIQPAEVPYYQSGSLEGITLRNRALEDMMIGMGFTQAMNSYLTNESVNYDRMGIEKEKNEYAAIANSVNSSISMVRTWLLPSLMNNLSKSQHSRMPHKVFELDMAFVVKSGKPVEQYHLAAVISEPKANLNNIKAAVEELMFLNRIGYSMSASNHGSFIHGRCGSVTVKGRSIGFFGEIHPKVLSNFSIGEPVSAFEINLDGIIGNGT